MTNSYPEADMGPFIPRDKGGLGPGLTQTLALSFIPRDMVGHRVGHELGSSDLGDKSHLCETQCLGAALGVAGIVGSSLYIVPTSLLHSSVAIQLASL